MGIFSMDLSESSKTNKVKILKPVPWETKEYDIFFERLGETNFEIF